MRVIQSFVASVAVLILAALQASPAHAETIIFDGLGVNTNDPVTVDGFVFDYQDHNGWAIGRPGVNLAGDFNNGTDVIVIRDTFDRDMTLRMTDASAAQFSVQSFDAADIFLGAAGGMNIEITGFLGGGGTVSTSISTGSGVYTTYVLPGSFTGLAAIEFHGQGTTGDAFALDNIGVNNPVPEPSTLALGAFGLVWVTNRARRRRRAEHTTAA
jgi:hypothetical protein